MLNYSKKCLQRLISQSDNRSFTSTSTPRIFLEWFQKPSINPTKDYPTLVLNQKSHPWLAPELDHEALTKLMIKSFSEDDHRLVLKIFKDLIPIWGCKPNQIDIRYYLMASGKTGAVFEALDWLKNSDKVTEQARNELLAGCVSFRDGLQVTEMNNTKKNETDYAHLIRLATAEGLTEERTRLVEEMRREGVQEGLLFHAAQLDDPRSLNLIKSKLEEGVELEEWIAVSLVSHLAKLGNEAILFESLSQLFDPRRSKDSIKSINILASLLSSITPPADLNSAQRLVDQLLSITGIDILDESKLASCLFDRMSIGVDFEKVTSWYQFINHRNNLMLPKYIGSILKFRSSMTSSPDLLRQLWDDFLACESVKVEESEDLGTAFLRISLDLRDWELVKTVLDELIKQKILLRSEVLEELVERFIQLGPDRATVYSAYEQLIRLGTPARPFFDRFLLNYLTRCESTSTTETSFEKPQALSMHALSNIFEHMRSAGVPPDSETYVRLLDHFTKVVKSNPRNLSTRLQVERLYTLFKLDAYVDPEIRVLHSFLKGFAYNGMYPGAWMIWKQISNEEQFRIKMTNSSLATMFDLAGYESESIGGGNGKLNKLAIEGWNRLKSKQDWPRCEMNKNLIDSWLECLCRSRHFNEAIQLVFKEMRLEELGIQPDQRTLSILLRFCRKESEFRKQSLEFQDQHLKHEDDLYEIVRDRIKDEFPFVWDQVQFEGLTLNEIEKRN